MNHRFRWFSAWILIQALAFSQILPPFALAQESPPPRKETLRNSQLESPAGLEELKARIQTNPPQAATASGLEELSTVMEAARTWFHPTATREDEKKLEEWLSRHGEEAIRQFMQLIAEDRGISVRDLGPYQIPKLKMNMDDFEKRKRDYPEAFVDQETKQLLTPEQYYEQERLRLMATVAIQRVLGRQVLVEVGLGYVGTASGLVHANTVADPRRLPPVVHGRHFRSPIREPETYPFFVIWYQRPSPSFYKILHTRQGIVPITTSDTRAPLRLRDGLERGTVFATSLAEAIAVSDIVLSETELEPDDRNPDDILESRIDEEATLRLLDRVATLVPSRETLILIVSTVTPGFTERACNVIGNRLERRRLVHSIYEAHVAHAPPRLQPGADWTQWLEFQRLAAPANDASEKPLRAYLDIVYSPENRRHFEITAPSVNGAYKVHPNPVTIEVEKSWENSWRNRLYELGVLLLQLGDELGFNAYEVADEIAKARPATHGLANQMAHLVGGFCVTNQDKQLLTALYTRLVESPVPPLAELELQRYFRSAAAARAVLAARARDFVLDYLLPSLERAKKRPDRFKLLLGGVAYRGETDETRQSGPEAFARHVRDIGGSNVELFAADPRVKYWLETVEQDLSHPGRLGYGMRNQEAIRRLQVDSNLLSAILKHQPDAIVMTTRHLEYIGMDQPPQMRTNPSTQELYPGLDPIEMIACAYGRTDIVLGDTFNFFSDRDLLKFLAHGWVVFGIGKGHIQTRLVPQVTDRMQLDTAQVVLKRLESKREDPAFDQKLLEKAIQVQGLRVRAFHADMTAGLEENPELVHARADLAAAEQELEFAGNRDQDRRALLQAKVGYLNAHVQALQSRRERDRQQAQAAKEEYERLSANYLMGGVAHMQNRVVEPMLHGFSLETTRLVRLLNALAPHLADSSRLLMSPKNVSLLAKIAQNVDMAWRDAREFHRTIDRLVEALLSPEQRLALAHELRVAEIPQELAVPKPLSSDEQVRLKARYQKQLGGRQEGISFLPAFLYVPELGKGFQKLVASDNSTMVAAVKFDPDLEMPDREIRSRQWGKHTLEIYPNEADAAILEYEKYPDFEGLPWEFRLLLDDLVRREKVLTTLEGTPQRRIGWVMPINLDERTPHHRRGRMAIPFFGDDRRPIIGASPVSGAPMLVEWKGTGPHVGGSPAGLKLEKAILRAGGGAKGVGRQEAWQIPGHMSSGEEIITLARMRLTPQYKSGDPAPPVPLARIRFRYKDDPARNEYEIVLRGAPSSRRLGHRLVDGSGGVSPSQAAKKMGWAAAFLLGMDPLAVHIALNGDNLYDNGMPTDTASFVSVGDERNPRDAFFEYFGYQIKHLLYTFQEVDDKDWEHPHTEYLKDWLDGFFGYLLNLQGEGQVQYPQVFQKYTQLTQEQLAGMTDPETQFVRPLLKSLWKYYVSYRVLEHRVALHGYDPTMESAYTSTHENDRRSKYHPELKANARAFLRHQKEVLGLARKLVEQKKYPPLTYLSGPRAGKPFDFKAAFLELDEKKAMLDGHSNGDYSDFYKLSFYGPRKPEYYDVIHPQNHERLNIAWYRHRKGYEKPSTALQARARLQQQLQGQNSGQQHSGLEEFQLNKAILLHEAQKHVIYPQGVTPKFSEVPAVFISADAGESSRFEKSIFLEGRQSEFALNPSASGPVTEVISKVIAPLAGQPVGWRPKAAAQSLGWPVIVVVGHQREEVMARYNAQARTGVTYAVQENPTEGNAAAFWRALAAGNLQNAENTVVVLTVGDHPLYDRNLLAKVKNAVDAGADLAIGAAILSDPVGKGRIVRDPSNQRIVGIIEQKDIDAISRSGIIPDWLTAAGYQDGEGLQAIRETNASIYAIRAKRLVEVLGQVTHQNAQSQYYITDIVSHLHEQILRSGRGHIEAVNIPAWQAVDLTGVEDLAQVEQALHLHASQLSWSAGLEEVPTLKQWEAYLADDDSAQEILAPHYAAETIAVKRRQISVWLEKLGQLRSPDGGRAFLPDRAAIITRTPGRIPLPLGGRHLDYLGFYGGSLGFPIRQEVVAFVQVADGLQGAVEVYLIDNPDPQIRKAFEKGPRYFSLSSPWVNPPSSIRTLAEWDTWAARVTQERRQARSPDLKINYADDIVAAVVSMLRTDFGDSSGRARAFFDELIRSGKGLRIGIASDLPSGGGLSSSSSVLVGNAQAIDLLAGFGFSREDFIRLGYAERFYLGTQGGVKDHAHLLYDAAFLGSGPTRFIQRLFEIPGVSLLLLDSGISRDSAQKYSEKLQRPRDDEQNIKGRTGVGYALGALWIRHHHPELTSRLRPDQDPSNPYGFLRNLLPNAPEGLPLADFYRLLREIPAEGLTRQQLYAVLPEFHSELDQLFKNHSEPPRPYPIREMVLFGFSEEARNWKTAEVLSQAEKGAGREGIFQRVLQIARTAHDGDRITKHRISSLGGTLHIAQESWDWHVSNEQLDWLIAHANEEEAALWRQSGWLERSIEPIDRLVDLIDFFNQQHGGDVAVGVIIGAGLGGSVVVLVKDSFVSVLSDFLQERYYDPLRLTPAVSAVTLPGRPAGLLTKPVETSAVSATQVQSLPGTDGLETVQLAQLDVRTPSEDLQRIAQALGNALPLPDSLQPALDGEYYPVSGQEMLYKILHGLLDNVREHVPPSMQPTARIIVSLTQEPINPHLFQRKLIVRYEDNNPEAPAVSLDQVAMHIGISEKSAPSGRGLYSVRQMVGVPNGGSLTIEWGSGTQRRRTEYPRLYQESKEHPIVRAQGLEITVVLPAGVVSTADPLNSRKVAERIRQSLGISNSAAGLEEPTKVPGEIRERVDALNRRAMGYLANMPNPPRLAVVVPLKNELERFRKQRALEEKLNQSEALLEVNPALRIDLYFVFDGRLSDEDREVRFAMEQLLWKRSFKRSGGQSVTVFQNSDGRLKIDLRVLQEARYWPEAYGPENGSGMLRDVISKVRPEKSQKGGALLTGMALAYANGADRVATFDFDVSNDLRQIPALMYPLEESSACWGVVGSRWLPDSIRYNLPSHSVAQRDAGGFYDKLRQRFPSFNRLTDPDSGVYLWNASHLPYVLEQVQEMQWGAHVDTVLAALTVGANSPGQAKGRVREVPISEVDPQPALTTVPPGEFEQRSDALIARLSERYPTAADNSFGGLEEQSLVFVGPDVAMPLLTGLEQLPQLSGRPVKFMVFARDASQKQQIQAGLEEAGLTPVESVIDVSAPPYKGQLFDAVADFQLKYMAKYKVYTLFTLAGLEELGRFLHIPSEEFRAWEERNNLSRLAPQA